MAFGDVYGYKTNSRFVVASAESDERETENPDWVDGGAQEDPDASGEPRYFYAVDLVLHGFANGRRNNCPVTVGAGAFNEVPTNTAVRAADVDALAAGTTPGETTGAVPGGGSGAVA